MLRRPGPPLIGALACFVGLAFTGLLAYSSPVAHGRDSLILRGFVGLDRSRLDSFVHGIAHAADPVPYALIGLALVLAALARGRPRTAIAIPVILVGAATTTELLKPLLAHPRYSEWLGAGQIDAAAWPSGHGTASMALALCGILAAPPRLRPTAAAVGAVFASAVSYAILVLGWHFPSDVIGGFFVAMMWTLVVVAALNELELRYPSRARREPAQRPIDALGPLALGAAVAVLALGVVADRPHAVAAYMLENRSFVVGAAAIAGFAVALAAGLARGVRG